MGAADALSECDQSSQRVRVSLGRRMTTVARLHDAATCRRGVRCSDDANFILIMKQDKAGQIFFAVSCTLLRVTHHLRIAVSSTPRPSFLQFMCDSSRAGVWLLSLPGTLSCCCRHVAR